MDLFVTAVSLKAAVTSSSHIQCLLFASICEYFLVFNKFSHSMIAVLSEKRRHDASYYEMLLTALDLSPQNKTTVFEKNHEFLKIIPTAT